MIHWTPGGCRLSFPGIFDPITPESCEKYDPRNHYFTIDEWKALNEQSCSELQQKICYLPNVDVSGIINTRLSDPTYIPQHHPPPNLVFLDLISDCTNVCGGAQRPAYRWIKGESVSTKEQWIDLQPNTPRTMKTLPVGPFNVIDKKSFLSAFQVVDYQRELDLVKQRFSCYWTVVTENLPPISCICQKASNNTNIEPCGCTINNGGNVLNVFPLCDSPIEIKTDFGKIIVDETFTLPEVGSCVETRVRNPTSVEEAVGEYVPVDSGRLFNTQKGRELYIYYKNSNNIITGQAIGAGYLFEYAQPITNSTGVTTCYNVTAQNDIINPNFNFPDYGIARIKYPIADGSSVELVDLTDSNDSNILCTPGLPEAGYLYFVIALSDNQGLTYIETLAASDVTAANVAIALYAIGIIVCIVLIVFDVKRSGRQVNRSFIKPVCTLIAVAFLFRLAYAAYLLGDPTNDPVTVLFIELPCLIFWTVASFLVLRWLKKRKKCAFCDFKCCMGTLRDYILLMVFANAGLFIAYLIVLFALKDGEPLEGSPLTDRQIVLSFIWFTWYENFTVIAFVWFVIAAVGAFSGVLSSDKTKSAVLKRALFIATFAALLIFVGQTSVIIRTFLWISANPLPGLGNWTISQFMLQLLIVDLVPVPIIIYSASTSPLGNTYFSQSQNEL